MSPALQVHPRLPPARRRPWPRTWWARAWLRAVQESSYDERDLARGRALARGGAVGGIAVGAGVLRAGVVERADVLGVSVEVVQLEEPDALVEVLAVEAGRAAALVSGDLPHEVAEHAEEAGVELFPEGRELSCSCTCAPWVDPCRHALAVLLQVGWLLEDDPLVLLHLRGLPREPLLAALRIRADDPGSVDDTDDLEGASEVGALEIAVDAAERARRLLALLEQDGGADEAWDHLW